MCLAIPGKVIAINGETGVIDFGGVVKQTNVSMADAKIGDWVVIHAGFAIEIMDDEDAQETLKLWNDVLDHDETFYG